MAIYYRSLYFHKETGEIQTKPMKSVPGGGGGVGTG